MKVSYSTTVGEVVSASGGTLMYGNPETTISTITTDSRDLGENNLFIPIIGERFDGHSFIELLLKTKGLSGYLTMREEHKRLAAEFDSSAILCDDTKRAFGMISSGHRDRIDPVVIGITGTNGKTTTKELVSSILSQKCSCLKNEKNYNNEIGVPFSLLRLQEHHRMAIIELGMNHPGEIERLSIISRPDVALITNVGEGHLEFLGSIENVAMAKSEIMHGMNRGSLVFLNRDTQSLDILQDKADDMGLHVKTFGLSEESDIYPEEYRLFTNYLEIIVKGERFRLPLYGIHNVYNGIAAIAVGMEFGIDSDEMREAFINFKNVDMRSQIFENDLTLIDDTYNSNPLSSRYGLQSAARVFPERRKIAVLSDMKELGELSELYHYELGKEVFRYGFDLLFAWGEMSEHITTGAEKAGMDKDNIFYFRGKDDLIDSIKKRIVKGDVILVKGSRSMKMEEVVDAIIH